MTKTKTNKWVEEFDGIIEEYHHCGANSRVDCVRGGDCMSGKEFIKKLITQTQQETLECAEKEIEKIFKDACLLNIDDDMKYWKRDKDNNSDADSKFFPQDLFDKVRQTIKQRKENNMKTKLTNDREELMEIKLAITRLIPTIPITKGLTDGLAIRKELQKIISGKISTTGKAGGKRVWSNPTQTPNGEGEPNTSQARPKMKTKPNNEWEIELKLKLDDIFEDAHSYSGPNIDQTFDLVFEFTKDFISKTLQQQREEKIIIDLFHIDGQGNEVIDKQLELDTSKIKHFKYCIANHYSDYKKLDENTREILRKFAELKQSLKEKKL